jgi:hypothetical protein
MTAAQEKGRGAESTLRNALREKTLVSMAKKRPGDLYVAIAQLLEIVADHDAAIAQARKEGWEAAIRAARGIADDRSIACDEAAKDYAARKPDEPYWAASERCAEREATSISIAIASMRYETPQ